MQLIATPQKQAILLIFFSFHVSILWLLNKHLLLYIPSVGCKNNLDGADKPRKNKSNQSIMYTQKLPHDFKKEY